MNELCLIVSGGTFCPLPEELRHASRVIACDRGYVHAGRLGLVPDLILGDFDSSPPPDTEIPVERFPERKDDSDTMLAVRRALADGFHSIAVCCAFGGRLDHTLANIQSAAWFAAQGGRARLIGTDADLLAFSGGTECVPRRDGWSLSVFSLSDCCEGVTIRGAKSECRGAALNNRFPLGLSNVWSADEAEITVESGVLAVLLSRLENGEHI